MNAQAVRLIDKLAGGNALEAKANDVGLNCCGIDVDFGVGSDFAHKGGGAGVDFTESAAMMI